MCYYAQLLSYLYLYWLSCLKCQLLERCGLNVFRNFYTNINCLSLKGNVIYALQYHWEITLTEFSENNHLLPVIVG